MTARTVEECQRELRQSCKDGAIFSSWLLAEAPTLSPTRKEN